MQHAACRRATSIRMCIYSIYIYRATSIRRAQRTAGPAGPTGRRAVERATLLAGHDISLEISHRNRWDEQLVLVEVLSRQALQPPPSCMFPAPHQGPHTHSNPRHAAAGRSGSAGQPTSSVATGRHPCTVLSGSCGAQSEASVLVKRRGRTHATYKMRRAGGARGRVRGRV